jgi:hypothetical protein
MEDPKNIAGFRKIGHPLGLWYTLIMNPSRCCHPFRFVQVLAGVVGAVAGLALFTPGLSASETSLQLSTQSNVTGDGKVTISLTVKNPGRQPLFHIHPMFHFHHTMSHMPMIHRLDPGQSVTLENTKHPRVGLVGSYPIVAMVNYKEMEKTPVSRTIVHTDSFYFEEPKVSLIEGHVVADVTEDSSLVRVLLKNPSASFKNIRLMLLLPPELIADRFQGMKGFTLRGGEEKYFEVPVRKVSGPQGGVYPIHLLVEYGELLRHYSGDIPGQINFGSVIGQGGDYWPQMLVFVFLAVTLSLVFYRRFRVLNST